VGVVSLLLPGGRCAASPKPPARFAEVEFGFVRSS